MSETAVFAKYVAAMLRMGQNDPEKARVAIQAQGDQVLAGLRHALRPSTRDSEKMVALIEMYLYTTLEMLVRATRSDDRIEFGEAEMKAWAVAGALDRAADAMLADDRDTAVAAMVSAEAVLGIDLSSLYRRDF